MLHAVTLKGKCDALSTFKEFKAAFENQNGKTIKCLHLDTVGEFEGMKNFLKVNGIQISRAAPHYPESNGFAEKVNQTIIGMIKCMLDTAGMSKAYWAEALRTTVYAYNSHPIKIIDSMPLLEAITGEVF